MPDIQVDDEVFQLLQAHARPFVDTPNDVLRRMLLDEGERGEVNRPSSQARSARKSGISLAGRDSAASMGYVKELLRRHFPEEKFGRVGAYRYMFESSKRLIYFQNFNKDGNHWWYRIHKRAWQLLKDRQESAQLCFTNPAIKEAYLLPVEDVISQVTASGWDRDYLEVNIDYEHSRWTDLEWPIGQYLIQ